MNFEDRVTKEYVEGLLGGCARIAYGTYTGNGEGTNTITVPFTPRLAVVSATNYDYWSVIDASTAIGQCASFRLANTTLTANKFYFSVDGNSLTLSNSNPAQILNQASVSYRYLAIG